MTYLAYVPTVWSAIHGIGSKPKIVLLYRSAWRALKNIPVCRGGNRRACGGIAGIDLRHDRNVPSCVVVRYSLSNHIAADGRRTTRQVFQPPPAATEGIVRPGPLRRSGVLVVAGDVLVAGTFTRGCGAFNMPRTELSRRSSCIGSGSFPLDQRNLSIWWNLSKQGPLL